MDNDTPLCEWCGEPIQDPEVNRFYCSESCKHDANPNPADWSESYWVKDDGDF